jgi:phage/plasmid-like protein (TIGR03299 family)
MANKATVAYRQDNSQPWIGIKGVATTGDIDQMFAAAKLGGWDVHKREIITDARTDSPDFEVNRTNPVDGLLDRLTVSKERYTTYQNEEVRDFAKELVHGDVTPVAMGALSGGRKIFMQFKIGDETVVKGTDDKVELFLNLRTSHDGSWAFSTNVGNMRLACQNMLTSIRANALSSFTIRHTKSMEGRIADARTALGLSVKVNAEFMKDMEVLAQADMDQNKFWALVKDIYPEPKKDVRGSLAKWTTKTDTIMGIYNGETLAGLDDTAYKAYNALNEHLFWYPSVRAGNVEGALVRASGMDDLTNKQNVGLYRRVLAAA